MEEQYYRKWRVYFDLLFVRKLSGK